VVNKPFGEWPGSGADEGCAKLHKYFG